jgi:NAD(P)H-flavin reductase
LNPDDLPPDFQFQPGQFHLLSQGGGEEVPSFLSGDPEIPGVEHTIHVVDKVTRKMQTLEAGDTIEVRGPFGSPWPLRATLGKDLIVMAGGIGLAALRPVLFRVLAERERYDHFSLLYGVRAIHEMLYKNDLADWRSRFDAIVRVTVDRATNRWRGTVGPVTKLIPRIPLSSSRTVVFLSGPEVMMRFCIRDLEGRGVSLNNIYLCLERNMLCATGSCKHTQDPEHPEEEPLLCQRGPIYRFSEIESNFYSPDW